jgi:uncharacterized protein involved in exopolysaccharide biosynthesis
MPNDIDERAVTISVRIYERLLATYPAGFRREYGPAMKQLFRDQCRDAWSEAQGRGLAVLWLRVLPDLAKTSFLEHLSNLNQRESIFMKMIRALRADPRLHATFLRAFAIVFLAAIVCSVLMALWLPRTYSSTVRIEVQKQPAHESGNADPYFLTTQFKIIESYQILTNVIADLHLDEKLPAQLGKPRWRLDETFAYLQKVIEVKQTRMTTLIEVTVKNPEPQLAANIANRIVDSYRNDGLNQWRKLFKGGIEAYQSSVIAQAQKLKEKQIALDELRVKLGGSEPDPKSTNSTTDYAKMLQSWTEREALAKVDYLEYSNLLHTITQIPLDRFGADLPAGYRSFLNQPELTEKSNKLSQATDRLTSAKAVYGADSPIYKTALQNLQQAQQEQDATVNAIVTGVRDRVQGDLNLIQVVKQNVAEINTRQHQDELYQPYFRLKDEVKNLRYNERQMEFYLNQEIAKAAEPDRTVTVRDPARTEPKPVNDRPSIFLTWLLGGTLLALVVGGAAALFAVLTRRFSHPPSAPS